MIIINAKDFDKCLQELYSLINDFALIVIIIIYIEDKNIRINKII